MSQDSHHSHPEPFIGGGPQLLGERCRSIHRKLRRLRWREVPGRVVELRRRRRRSEAVGRLLPSATSALRRNLSGNAGRVLLPLLERCVTVAQAWALPIVRCEGGLVAGVLVRVLVLVVSHVFE